MDLIVNYNRAVEASSPSLHHALPVEVIRTVLEWAAGSDKASGAKLCRLCSTVRLWLLPVLYDTVILSSAKTIERFAYGQVENPDSTVVYPPPASVVRRLWIGPTSSTVQNDLVYSPSAWPITLVHQILVRCASLHALAIVNLYQGDWFRLAHVLPAGLHSLTLGPVHGKVVWWYLPCSASLREFTSMDTEMMDLELLKIVAAPSIRTVRRVYSRVDHVNLAFDQLDCVDKASSLEKFEIICCAKSVERAASVLEKIAKGYKPIPERVVLVPKSYLCGSTFDPIAVLFNDWLSSWRT
ncbi:hypothetical protein GY45DRAFT_1322423 [Cubamyces sp. BRFM 1775]|nr:hypothetical protein GY45DRAFT_1322423 [Cubamyces sp. BRFM 1775]